MFSKILKKMKKINQKNYYLSTQQSKQEEDVSDQQSAEFEMINSLTNYKLIISHLKGQDEEKQKFLQLIRILAQEEIDLVQLKLLFYNYISYQYYTLRSLVWRVLLGYLPVRNNKWVTKMETSKVSYQKLLGENLISTIKRKPKEIDITCKTEEQNNKGVAKISTDHPLSKDSNSGWNTYFKDHELWTRIEKDILRTRTKVKFFQEEHELDLETFQFEQPLHLSKNKRKCYHYDALTRILFLYTKLHPEIGYAQGMNQIVALLYFSLTNKNTQYERRVSESDTYHIFCIVMDRLGPHHFTSQESINERIRLFSESLKKVDQKLYKILQDNKVDIKLGCMKWIMVFMLQQFEINEAMLIWDGLLCSEIGMSKYIHYLCLAVMVIKREELIENPTSLYLEFNIKPCQLLETAMHLYKEYPKLMG